MIKYIFTLSLLLAAVNLYSSEPAAEIIMIKGDIKVRFGLDEAWQPAAVGMIIKDIDTILSGEQSEVVIKTTAGSRFILGANAILDIADLRKIQEKELFLFLMSEKVDNIETLDNKTPLRIGNVSLVHGAQSAKGDSAEIDSSEQALWQAREVNGAIALFFQDYFNNSIVKLHKILQKYSDISNPGLIHFYLGKGFEAIKYKGKAIYAYKQAIIYFEKQVENPTDHDKLTEARMALEKLQKG